MARYKIWDKQEDIFTLGVNQQTKRNRSTAQQVLTEEAPWADNPNVHVVILDDVINGSIFWELGAMKKRYKQLGANITDDMSPEQVLAAIEYFEDNPPPAPFIPPDSTERLAAAIEFQNLMNY